MRLLFVSSTTAGGSGRSQRELAGELVKLGHEVRFLVGDEVGTIRSWVQEKVTNLSVKLDEQRVGILLRRLRQFAGRKPNHQQLIEDLDHLFTPFPQNALPTTVADWHPDIIVGNSVERWAWREIVRMAHAADLPTILYLREDDSLGHLDVEELPDAFVANAESLARVVRDRGFACPFIPSVIDVSATATSSTRRTALTINPIASRGLNIVLRIAERLPDVHFVLQESWTLAPEQFEDIEQRIATLENVEIRRSQPPGPGLYGDARIVLVPYRVDNRPRVITEAQANGIPVVVGDTPALVEAIGPGGAVVGLDDIDAWVRTIAELWSNDERYHELSRGAEIHARRPEISGAAIASRFVELASATIAVY